MMERCYRPRAKGYERYGGRGIEVCPRWRKFVNFEADMLATFRPDLSLDRIDVHGNYCKENCRWATPKQQANNREQSYFTFVVAGKRKVMTIKEAAQLFKLSPHTIQTRMIRGWSAERLGIKRKHDRYEKDKYVLH